MARGMLSFTPKIAKPCEESWAAMQGSARERHCAACDKQVHNFAAMTSREIERLVRETGGELCARITQRDDGALVTLGSQSKATMAAQIVMSASLVVGAVASAAQGKGEQVPKADAVLTGTVLKPWELKPAKGAVIWLTSSGATVTTTIADEQGNFRISAIPGTYNILIRHQLIYGATIFEANLHPGEQSLQPIQAHSIVPGRGDDGSYRYTSTMGEIIGIEHYTLAGAVRHPLSYLKYLVRKL